VTEVTILRYFQTFNAGNFAETAALFAVDGALHPPFESPVVVPLAIAAYLKQEAKGMRLFPKEKVALETDNGYVLLKVTGKVKTPLFGLNVGWIFVLNSDQEIAAATILLLASPQELLNLRHYHDRSSNN